MSVAEVRRRLPAPPIRRLLRLLELLREQGEREEWHS
jgi:hypothetical protein